MSAREAKADVCHMLGGVSAQSPKWRILRDVAGACADVDDMAEGQTLSGRMTEERVLACLRSTWAVARISGALREMVLETFPGIIAKQRARAALAPKESGLTRRSEMHDFAEHVYGRVIRYTGVHKLYSHSSSKWAGGNTDVQVRIAPQATCSGDSHAARSNNGKWSGTDTSLTFTLRASWGQTVRARGLMLADAGKRTVLVLDASEHEAIGDVLLAQCSYAAQGRGFDLRCATGWIVRDAKGACRIYANERAARKSLA